MVTHPEFDFDLMARLAKDDPAEFARKREELIQDMINQFKKPEDGRRIQFEIDLERMRTPPGEKTCIAMVQRMGAMLGQISALFADIQTLATQHRHSHSH